MDPFRTDLAPGQRPQSHDQLVSLPGRRLVRQPVQNTVHSDTGQALGIDRWYIAHEYTHALQDQHFHLSKLQRFPIHHHIHNSDAYTAVHALIEGDAVTVQNNFMETYYTQSEKQALFRQIESTRTAALPRALEEQFTFPYTAGPTYVQHLVQTGGYRVVDAAFRHPPTTSYQILILAVPSK